MRESFTSGTVGGALGNQRIYPELLGKLKLITLAEALFENENLVLRARSETTGYAVDPIC